MDDSGLAIGAEGPVTIVTLSGRDGNRLTPALIDALDAALSQALADTSCAALVLTTRGGDFCAGAVTDLPPPGPDALRVPPALAALSALCARIAASPKPVVAGVQGRVLSGGLALALAARGVVARGDARFGFPETRLARIAPGNGLVRAAWRLGASGAWTLATRAQPLSATEALALGLVDSIENDTPLSAAVTLARLLARENPPFSTAGLADAPAFRAAVEQVRAAMPRSPAPDQRHLPEVLACIEAAQLLPPDQALAFDLIRAEDAATAPVARTLAHAARAARRVLDIPERALVARGVALKGVLGLSLSDTHLARVALPLMRAGQPVRVLAPDDAAFEAACAVLSDAHAGLVTAGAMTREQAEADWNLVTAAQTPDGCVGVLTDTAEAAGAGVPTVLWSSNEVPGAAVVLCPAPGPAPRLVEVILGRGAEASAVALACAVALRMGLTPVRVQGSSVLRQMAEARAAAIAAMAAGGIDVAGLSLRTEPGTTPSRAEHLLVLAMVNAGVGLLFDEAVLRPSDIDAALVLSGEWPRWRGGPMAEADMLGPLVVRRGLDEAEALGLPWAAHPMLDEMLRRGWRFDDLNKA